MSKRCTEYPLEVWCQDRQPNLVSGNQRSGKTQLRVKEPLVGSARSQWVWKSMPGKGGTE